MLGLEDAVDAAQEPQMTEDEAEVSEASAAPFRMLLAAPGGWRWALPLETPSHSADQLSALGCYPTSPGACQSRQGVGGMTLSVSQTGQDGRWASERDAILQAHASRVYPAAPRV